ncbi:lipid droplet-associated hydrolase isoform X2 [Venturia canescens]|nr:lipid droplet-associated hydrolase isoform X2 [Venturia canescens]XP_043290068.1 lipid droplet-associated hydrolase isoform X2 [Venturia canescens]XP_043290069.1 lipid droplet-associated hydrolase isoform X2 [Venturia canescens]
MQQAMIRCNGVQTHVLTEGRWVEEGLDPNGKKDLVLVIPGNPGIPSFYEDFAKALKSKLPSETPVWVVGHAGHVQPPSNLWYSPDDRVERNKYNLDGQRKHKTEFLKQYVPKDARIHLVGHSIGSWFTLKLLDDPNYTDQIVKSYMLFPTIERMAESPSGKFLTGKVLPISSFIVFLSWLLSFVPNILTALLVRVFGGLFAGVTNKSVKPVMQLLDPSVLRRVFRMAKDEMGQVRERDDEAIEKHEKKLWLYYGATDSWTPKKYYEELKSRHPNVDAQICKRGFRHAFVLQKDDIELGHMVGEMINATIK